MASNVSIPDLSNLPTSSPNPLAQLAGQALQQQPQPPQQPTQGMPQAPPSGGDDQLDQLKSQLIQQYQQEQTPPMKGGRIKQLLANFFYQGGEAMQKSAGLPTDFDKQQKTLSNIMGVANAQAGLGYKQALASQFDTVPYQLPSGETISVQRKDLHTIIAAQQRAQATTTAAQTRTIDVPGIGAMAWDPAQKKYVPVQGGQVPQTQLQPGEAEALGFAPGIQSVPTSIYSQAVGSKTKQQTTVAGENDVFNVNKLTNEKTALGVGNRAAGAAGARYVPVADPSTGLVSYTPAAQAFASGGLAPTSALEKNAFVPKARFDDIGRATTFINDKLGALDQESSQRALMAKALADPASKEMGAMKTFGNSELYKQMSPQSRDYVNGILSLREQIMGANAMLTGAAGVSDSRVRAIWDTLPGLEPDSDNARRKMTQVAGMVSNLKEAFPQVGAVEKLKAKAAAANFSAPRDAPPAPQQDGHKLKDAKGNILAISRGGKWASP